MLYELIAVVRPNSLSEIREIARTSGMTVLNSGGVIRGFTNWGPLFLPKRTRKHQAYHIKGHYFIMRFDCSASVQESVRYMLGSDPRMIKFSVVKLGSKLDEICKVSGKTWKIYNEGLDGVMDAEAPWGGFGTGAGTGTGTGISTGGFRRGFGGGVPFGRGPGAANRTVAGSESKISRYFQNSQGGFEGS